jgi:pimeloyl-ACP methyl ester carboxylesterase
MNDLLRHLALYGAGAFGFGVAVYVAVSFVMMRQHTEARGGLVALREAAREAFWAAVVQPLVPLFYVVGRRMGGRGGGVPVVLVHGYTQNRANFLRIAFALLRAGSGPLYGFNYPWWSTVPANAVRLARFVERVRAETGAREVDLVCHSLGGVVAMEYLASAGERHGIRRCVTIASPLAGVVWRGPIIGACASQLRHGCEFLRAHAATPLAVPCLSVYSTHDNVVHPPSTSTLEHRGGKDHVVAHVPHLSILFAPAVSRAVTGFLLAAGAPAALEAASGEYQVAS